MRFYNFLIISLALLFYSTTGDSLRSKSATPDSVPGKSDKVVLKPIPAVLIENREQLSDAIETRINISEKMGSGQFVTTRKLEEAHFVDAHNGWARTDRSIYKTSDGGKTWQHLALDLPPNAHVTSFFFVDAMHGWLVIVNQSQTERYGLGNSSLIMATSDGGRSWMEQASFPDEVKISCLRFLNAQEGIVTGAKVIDHSPPYDEIFAINTSDGGKTWNDISERIKVVIKDVNGIANDYGRHIEWSTSSDILLLTRFGKIISSNDKGKTWKSIVQLEDERPYGFVSSTGYRKVGLDTRGHIRVIASAEGEEGYWGNIITNDDRDSWTSYELIRTPIRDAVFLSDKEVLACGIEVQTYDEKTKTRQPPVGIILHSTDSGKTWSAIYRSKASEPFVSLVKVDDRLFYVVGDGGAFLRLTLKSG